MKIIREIPEAPWAGALQRPLRRSHHWRMIQRRGEAEVAAWEEEQSEENPECSYGTARQPETGERRGQDKGGMKVQEKRPK